MRNDSTVLYTTLEIPNNRMSRFIVYKWTFTTTVWSEFITMSLYLMDLSMSCYVSVATAMPAQQQRVLNEDDIIHPTHAGR